MRIVVAGAGDLGFTIAKTLVADEFDVVLVDRNPDQCREIQNNIDCLVFCDEVTSTSFYQRQDVVGADLFIACIGKDEENLVACMLAKHYGITKTIACVKNADYSRYERKFLEEQMQIDMVLNPSHIMAMEIAQVVTASSSLNVEQFADGKVSMFEAKLTEDSEFLGCALKDLELPEDILAAMITRKNRVLIPSGNDLLMEDDYVYFVGTTEKIEEFQKHFPQIYTSPKKIMVIGAGRTGRFLAPLLVEKGKQVKIVDKDEERCRRMAAELQDATVLQGDGMDMNFLEEEGVHQADLIIAITDDDRLNLMTALVAKHLGARRSLVRLNHTEYLNLMEKAGVDMVLSSQMLAAAEILRFAHRGEVVNVAFLGDSRVEAVELVLGQGSSAQDKQVKNLSLSKDSLLCAIVRGNQAHIPKGSTTLLAGDRLVVLSRNDKMKEVTKLFESKE